MIVTVTLHQATAVIEGDKVFMSVPVCQSLRSRMRGKTKAQFRAELVHNVLEIDEMI